MEMPSVPSPPMPTIVRVRVAPVLLSKLSVPLAVPVMLRCTLDEDSVLAWKLASVYVTVKVTGPVVVMALEGALIITVGLALSTVNVVLGHEGRDTLRD